MDQTVNTDANANVVIRVGDDMYDLLSTRESRRELELGHDRRAVAARSGTSKLHGTPMSELTMRLGCRSSGLAAL